MSFMKLVLKVCSKYECDCIQAWINNHCNQAWIANHCNQAWIDSVIVAWPGSYSHIYTRIVCELLPSLGVRRLLSVVCKLFTFQASSPKPLGRLEPNLAGMLLGWSSTKLLFFVPVGYSIWLPGPIICSDWLKFQRSSSLKLMNRLNPNCK